MEINRNKLIGSLMAKRYPNTGADVPESISDSKDGENKLIHFARRDKNTAKNRPAGRDVVYPSGSMNGNFYREPAYWLSKGKSGVDDRVNDQYERGNVGNGYETVDNSFLGDKPVKPKVDARDYKDDRSPKSLVRRREEKNARDKYDKERQKWLDITDEWDTAQDDRHGVNGKFNSFEANRRNAEAARSIFKDELKKPLTKETWDGMSEEKKLLLTRMLDQKLADETDSLPKWVGDANKKYDLGYTAKSWDEKLSGQPSYGGGLRNGKRK